MAVQMLFLVQTLLHRILRKNFIIIVFLSQIFRMWQCLFQTWYYNEVQWAWANGLTVGTSATTFSPDKVCTRAEAVEFLYNAFAE